LPVVVAHPLFRFFFVIGSARKVPFCGTFVCFGDFVGLELGWGRKHFLAVSLLRRLDASLFFLAAELLSCLSAYMVRYVRDRPPSVNQSPEFLPLFFLPPHTKFQGLPNMWAHSTPLWVVLFTLLPHPYHTLPHHRHSVAAPLRCCALFKSCRVHLFVVGSMPLFLWCCRLFRCPLFFLLVSWCCLGCRFFGFTPIASFHWPFPFFFLPNSPTPPQTHQSDGLWLWCFFLVWCLVFLVFFVPTTQTVVLPVGCFVYWVGGMGGFRLVGCDGPFCCFLACCARVESLVVVGVGWLVLGVCGVGGFFPLFLCWVSVLPVKLIIFFCVRTHITGLFFVFVFLFPWACGRVAALSFGPLFFFFFSVLFSHMFLEVAFVSFFCHPEPIMTPLFSFSPLSLPPTPSACCLFVVCLGCVERVNDFSPPTPPPPPQSPPVVGCPQGVWFFGLWVAHFKRPASVLFCGVGFRFFFSPPPPGHTGLAHTRQLTAFLVWGVCTRFCVFVLFCGSVGSRFGPFVPPPLLVSCFGLVFFLLVLPLEFVAWFFSDLGHSLVFWFFVLA